MVVGSRTHGRGTFFVNSDKESTQRKRLSFQFCQRVGLTRNPARRPQFAVHGELPLPKLKTEAGCTGWGKAERQKARPDPVLCSIRYH